MTGNKRFSLSIALLKVVVLLVAPGCNKGDGDSKSGDDKEKKGSPTADRPEVPKEPAKSEENPELRKAAQDLRKLLAAMKLHQKLFVCLPSAGYGAGYGKDDPTDRAFVFRYVSWRVAILVFNIEKDNDDDPIIYNKIQTGQYGPLDRKTVLDFWKTPEILNQRPDVYAGGENAKESTTTWRVFVGKGAAFEKDRLLKLPQDFPDGLGQTILIVEASEAVPWTKPDELLYGPNKPLPKLGGRFKEGFLAGFADGSVRLIPYQTDEKVIRALITRNGGEKIDKLPGRVIK